MTDNSNIDNILDRYYQDRTLDVIKRKTFFAKAGEKIEPADWHEEAKQAIQQELLKARIDELKRLKKIDVFNELYNTDPRPSKLVDIRITDLQNQNQTS